MPVSSPVIQGSSENFKSDTIPVKELIKLFSSLVYLSKKFNVYMAQDSVG